jgi:hypothetical protein
MELSDHLTQRLEEGRPVAAGIVECPARLSFKLRQMQDETLAGSNAP